jgi:hydroxyethylthiazole kinase-like uncharacterized protein yjeF
MGVAAALAARWTRPVEEAAPERLAGAEIIIDALFGAGLARRVEGEAAALIGGINRARQAGAAVVAVDLPSGINGDTGVVMGVAVEAAQTVTFFRRKPGHLLMPGRLHCGRLTIADIGIAAGVLDRIRPQSFANQPALWRGVFPVPAALGHKYQRGHTVVVSGNLPMTGAARLAARGALRCGAGLVTLATPKQAVAVNAAASLAVMVAAVDGPAALAAFLADKRRNSVVLGPGGGVGPATRRLVLAALKSDAAVVLDADALTSFAGQPEPLFKAIGKRRAPVVLTPHEGEYDRLFNNLNKKDKANSKLEKASLSAHRSKAVVVLKGPDTVVAAPDGRAAIADNAPPTLATAGSGDVLAGMIAGLLAQGMPAFEAAAAAVWLHGEAGAAFGPGLIAEDLPEMLPGVLRALLGASATS